MATFKAEMDTEKLKIIITCDTFWSCTCDGNIVLSKFSGEGNDEIDLLKDGYTWFYSGNVTFTYGDEHCDYPVVQVAYNDNCSINTLPNYITCVNDNDVEERVLYFKYDSIYDTFLFTVVTAAADRWELENDGGHTYFVNGNDIMIVANTTNDFTIKPKDCEDTTKFVHVKVIQNK